MLVSVTLKQAPPLAGRLSEPPGAEHAQMEKVEIISPNINVKPSTAAVNAEGHLVVGGCDTVELAERFGTPLWVLDETTIRQSVAAIRAGLAGYPDSKVLYAGKAFLCLAMCHLIRNLGLGLDVVSAGELYTAGVAGFPAGLIYMHGNNKSAQEIRDALSAGDVKIVVDSRSELNMVVDIARDMGKRATILLRVTPGVVPDTHHYIRTGHPGSKFGLSLEEVQPVVAYALEHKQQLRLIGLHAHIGSQSHHIEPYLEIVDILADFYGELKRAFGLELLELDVGGGLGIAYVDTDRPTAIHDWVHDIASKVQDAFTRRDLGLPVLVVEPGRSIVGTAGVTIYRAGHSKKLPGGEHYLAVDGGMADNPRPVTYQAKYTAGVANRMSGPPSDAPLTLVGRYCESGDIIVKDAYLSARTGDLIAIFGTGAYNYSMASNYNRTGRPACVMVNDGKADVIIERETCADLVRKDRVPTRLLEDHPLSGKKGPE